MTVEKVALAFKCGYCDARGSSGSSGSGIGSIVECSNLRIRAARWRECIYVLQMFFSVFFLFFFPSVKKYESTVLGNG